MSDNNATDFDSMPVAALGRLFPIILSAPQACWKTLFAVEETSLRSALSALPPFILRHIGSTSVSGLIAKPTVDMLLEIDNKTDISQLVAAVRPLGYEKSNQPDAPAPHIMFCKGYGPTGYIGQTFHLHVRYAGDWDEPHFCAYLRSHPETAQKYADLKRHLAQKYVHDREAYTQGKTKFVKKITALARQSGY